MHKTKIWVILGSAIFLLIAGGLLALFSNYPILNRVPSSGPAVVWPGLPTPIKLHSNWTSFVSTTAVNETAVHDGLIWAGTDGGVVVWSEVTGDAAHFTVEHGLADNVVTAVSVAADGAIWLGTASGGLNRFDGTTWQSYSEVDGLPSNQINDIAIGDDGLVWVATDKGVAQFNGRKWYLFNEARSLFQLPSDNITTIVVGNQPGTVWVGTDLGVAFYNGRFWESFEQTGSQAINEIHDLAVTANDTVWAATNAGLTRLLNGQWELYSSADGLIEEELRTVTAVSDPLIWVTYANPAHGITQLDFSSGAPAASAITLPPEKTFQQITNINPSANGQTVSTDNGVWLRANNGSWQPLRMPPSLPINEIRGMTQSNETVWIASEKQIGRFRNGMWQFFDSDDGLPHAQLFAMSTDVNNTVWASFNNIRDGVAYFDESSKQWQQVGCGLTGPPSARVRAAVADADGNLWFATIRGLAKFDGQRWNIIDEADGLPSQSIQTLTRDIAGNLWVGTDLGLLTLVGGQWQSVNQHDIRELTIGPDGLVWMITDEEILRWDGSTETAVPTPPAGQIFDLLATENGFWIATADGIFLYRDNQYVAQYTMEDGLGANRVTSLMLAADGTLWAGNSTELIEDSHPTYGSYTYQSNYLSRFDGQTWQSLLLTPPQGIHHSIVTDLAVAENGDLWAATLNGISRWQDGQWQTFDKQAGLPSMTVLQTAVSQNGVWAVTANGLIKFDAGQNRWQTVPKLADVWELNSSIQLTTDANGRLWAGAEQTVASYEDNQWQLIPATPPVPQASIRALTTDANGRLWVATSSNDPQTAEAERYHLGVYDGQQWQWMPLAWQNQTPATIHHLTFAPDGRLWFVTDNGIFRLTTNSDNLSSPELITPELRESQFIQFLADGTPLISGRYQKSIHLLNRDNTLQSIDIPIPDVSHVYSAVAANDGAIWVGTDQGVARYVPNQGWDAFHFSDSSSDHSMTTMIAGEDGSIWLGTFAGHLIRVENDAVTLMDQDGFPNQSNPIGALAFDEEGNLWKGVFGGAISRLILNAQNGRSWQRFPANVDFTETAVNGFTVDNEGTAWLGTDNGLFTITSVADETTCRFVREGEDFTGNSLLTDAQNTVWVVDENILWRGNQAGFERMAALILPITSVAPDGAVWTADKNNLIRIVGDTQQEIALDEGMADLTAIAFDANGRIWLGTTAGAWTEENGRWVQFTTANGLANNHVTHITITTNGAIWIATEGGLSQYIP